MTAATILGRSGPGIADRVRFELVLNHEPSRDEVADAQTRAGYHPDGYGGPHSVRVDHLPDGEYRATWTCAASCD